MESLLSTVLIVVLVSYISAVPSHHESRPTSAGLLTKPNPEKPEDTMISILPFPFPNNQQTVKPNRPGSRPSRPPFTILPFPNPDPQNPIPISIQLEPSTATTTEHSHDDHFGDNNLHMRPEELRFFFNKTGSIFNLSSIFSSFG